MSDTVAVLYVVNGTTVDETHTAERISCQNFAGGRAMVKLYRDGQPAEVFLYAHAERIHRTIGTREDA